jgi:hypothetical protein
VLRCFSASSMTHPKNERTRPKQRPSSVSTKRYRLALGHGGNTRQLAIPVRSAGSPMPSRRSVRLENVIFCIAGGNAGLQESLRWALRLTHSSGTVACLMISCELAGW